MSEQSKGGRGRPPYPPVRERAVRMVFDHQDEYLSQWKAIESISVKLQIHHETLCEWVRRAGPTLGPAGATSDERARIRWAGAGEPGAASSERDSKAAVSFLGIM